MVEGRPSAGVVTPVHGTGGADLPELFGHARVERFRRIDKLLPTAQRLAPAIGRRRLPRRSRSEPLRGAASATSEKTPSRPNSPNPRAQQLHRARAVLTSAASMRLAAAASRSAMSRRRRSPSRLSSHGMYSRASTSAHVGGTIPSRSALRETTRRRCSSRSARTHSTATSLAPV